MKSFFLFALIFISAGLVQAQENLHINGNISRKFDNQEIKLIKYIGYKNFLSSKLELTDTILSGKFSFNIPAQNPELYLLIINDYKKNKDGNFAEKRIDFYADKETFEANIDSAFKMSFAKQDLWNLQLDSLSPFLKGNLYAPGEIISNKISFIEKNPNSPLSVHLLTDLHNEISDNQLNKLVNNLSPNYYKSAEGMFLKFLTDSTIIGKQLPEFELADTLGNVVKSSSFRGQYLFLDFWASWCLPCRAENSYIKEINAKYKDKLKIVQVSFDDIREKWVNAIKTDKTEIWQHLSDLKGWNSKLSFLFNLKSIPANMLIDPNGKIIQRNLRGSQINTEMKKIF